MIVLFNRENVGMVVKSGKDWLVGHYATNWNMDNFVPFHGKITIEVE